MSRISAARRFRPGAVRSGLNSINYGDLLLCPRVEAGNFALLIKGYLRPNWLPNLAQLHNKFRKVIIKPFKQLLGALAVLRASFSGSDSARNRRRGRHDGHQVSLPQRTQTARQKLSGRQEG